MKDEKLTICGKCGNAVVKTTTDDTSRDPMHIYECAKCGHTFLVFSGQIDTTIPHKGKSWGHGSR